MSNNIKMSPADMRRHAQAYTKAAGEMDALLKRMDKIKTELSSAMDGQTVDSFSSTYERLKPSFREMKELVDRIGKALKNTADNMEEQDRRNAAQFK